MDIKEKALLMTPCEVCEMLGQKRGCRPEDDRYTCGIYAEIILRSGTRPAGLSGSAQANRKRNDPCRAATRQRPK